MSTTRSDDTPALPDLMVQPHQMLTGLLGKWYVAHTRSRNEKLFADELSRLGIFSYLPLTRRVTRSRKTRRISRSVVPVFPGYVFLNGTEEQRYLALRTNRIAHLLDVPNQQQLVEELERIQFLLCHTREFAVADHLKVGDWGRIIAGPLAGLEGVVTAYPNRLRLSMNVTILGQSVSVEVDSDNVERIDPPDPSSSGGRFGTGAYLPSP